MRKLFLLMVLLGLFTNLSAADEGNFYFFHSYKCPHCKDAKPFIHELEKKYTKLKFHDMEVINNPEYMKLFREKSQELNIQGGGVPLFVLGDQFIVGFQSGVYEKRIIQLIEGYIAKAEGETCIDDEKKEKQIEIPMFWTTIIIDPEDMGLPLFTFIVGLLDGINPCAMWVLMFLLTLLVNAKSRKKLIMIGSVFVISSAVVYFLFMTAWLNIFMFMGITDTVTIVLGSIAILMGLINLKEFFFFKKGVSLMIPESAKPKLFEKMRNIMNNSNVYLSLLGTIALAFFVNLIELGCTIGLPAIYTRVLSIQTEMGNFTKYLYMFLYNLYYVIPLAIIVTIFVVTMGKHRFQEKHAKVLKVVSGLLMVLLGVVLVIKPELLQFG